MLIITSIAIILFASPETKKTTTKIIQDKLNNINYNYISATNQKIEDYLLIIEIPKIDLRQKVYNFDSKLNDIEKNIEILKSSSLEHNTIILASHSGTNKNAYFNNLINLSINDLIYIYRKQTKYIYKITKTYYVNKTGYLEIPKTTSNMIFLITCSTIYQDKQLIIEGILIKSHSPKNVK